jgi:hypothetical protein
VKNLVQRLPAKPRNSTPAPNDDEALDQGHEELSRDDRERDDHDDRRDTGDEARKEAVEETEIRRGVEDLVGQGETLIEDAGGAEVRESGGTCSILSASSCLDTASFARNFSATE